MGKVGLFFYVNKNVLIDSVDIDNAEIYGDFKIGRTSHYEIWDRKYYEIYNKDYDYFPRGRVVYKYKENKYILYADKCIDDEGIMKIKNIFEIQNENLEVDRTDSHYVCKNCNKYYLQ